MPGIWNVNNGYNMNTRKVSSKLTFEVGEKFTGRIVDKGDGKDVTIKLADGWQFIAEVDGKVNLDDLKLVKFQVDGFENGKLKLKIVQVGNSRDDVEDGDENYQDVVDKEGLSKEDINLLKKMVRHNFSLTKENINELKIILQFAEKVNSDSEELNAFIEKYIASKGVEIDSEQGKAMKEMLIKFISEFKNMSEDDILTFLENNIDFTKDNIESFNKLFKGDSSIEKILASIKEKLDESDIKVDVKDVLFNDINKQDETEEKPDTNMFNKAAFSKVYAENDPSNNKIDVLNILKTLAGDNTDEVESSKVVKEIILDKSLMEKLNNSDIADAIKSVVGEKISEDNSPKTQASSLIESLNKARVEEILSKAEGKEVKLTDTEYKKAVEIVQNKSDKPISEPDSVKPQNADTAALKSDRILSTQENSVFIPKKIENSKVFTNNFIDKGIMSENKVEGIKSEIKSKIDNVRDIVKELLTHTTAQDSVSGKVADLIKENINDIKVFNSMSNEYYCLNFDISAQMNKYPCKLIIKDNRKDGKKIDTTNAKMILSIKTSNLGDIDGYLTMRENKMDVNLKCDDKYTIVLDNHKRELTEGLSTLGLFVNVKVTAKEQPADIVSARDFFNDVTISAIDTMV
ncbi:flagellar hook-length control protein FliK [uncultured Clostridium sp.]|uniref:flagellar hook-length control protein FliK n=1 Tax=uncultured Clostridium sp. TaxID=59620 RepID=UPI0025FEF6D3|nr:flagellar hook-length control protein FliK [uncultured Clostridium sp.]